MKPVCDAPGKEVDSFHPGHHAQQSVIVGENEGTKEQESNNTNIATSHQAVPISYQTNQPYVQHQQPAQDHYDSVGATTTTTSESLTTEEELEDEDKFIEVKVSEPAKVGDGITSYMAYRVCTRTNLGCFKRQEFWVTRRFSDFLGLHEKLQERYASQGRLIPPPPEKNLVGTTKVKISSSTSPTASGGATADGASPEQSNGHAFQQGQTSTEGGAASSSPGSSSSSSAADRSEFIARRRFALERFINRVSAHPVLRLDPATVRFLESVGELPRATSTSALSSASVLRLFGRAADTVTKMTTYRMEETDPWYREKVPQIEQLDSQLRKLCGLAESLVQCRQELAMATGSFAQGAAILSSTEEAHSLSRALAQLARVEERVQQVHHR